MEKVIYANSQGLGVILDNNDNEKNIFDPIPVLLHGEILEPGQFTSLDGLFNEKLRFVGFLKNEKNVMCFFIGEEKDLFSNIRYYYCFFYINENRIANKYKEGTARDYNWINNKWK